MLSPRQLDVLERIARGMNHKQAARDLGIGVDTVKHHLTAIMLKLGAENAPHMVALAYETGLLPRGKGRWSKASKARKADAIRLSDLGMPGAAIAAQLGYKNRASVYALVSRHRRQHPCPPHRRESP